MVGMCLHDLRVSIRKTTIWNRNSGVKQSSGFSRSTSSIFAMSSWVRWHDRTDVQMDGRTVLFVTWSQRCAHLWACRNIVDQSASSFPAWATERFVGSSQPTTLQLHSRERQQNLRFAVLLHIVLIELTDCKGISGSSSDQCHYTIIPVVFGNQTALCKYSVLW